MVYITTNTQTFDDDFSLLFHCVQVVFAFDPSIQPRVGKIYDAVISNSIGEIHMAPALMRFYVGKFFNHRAQFHFGS